VTDNAKIPPDTADTAVQWCIQARKLLKLGVFERDKLDLKKRATAVKDQLQALRAKFGDTLAKSMEAEFITLAKRIDTAAQGQNLALIEIEAERLNVLNKQMLLKLAEKDKDPIKAKGKAQIELDKAIESLNGKQEGVKAKYQKLSLESHSKLNLLRAMKYATPAVMEARINAAALKVATVGSEDWAGGLDLLNSVAGLYETGKSEAEGWQAKDLLHAKQQPHYESKQVKLQEVLDELGSLPGVDSYRELIKRAQKEGAAAIKRPEGNPLEIALFDEGYKAIAALVPSTSDLLNKALQAAAKAQKLISKDTDIHNAEDAARAVLARLRVSGAELIGEATESLHDTQIAKAVLLCGETGKKPFGIQRLNEIKGQLDALELARKKVRDGCKTLLDAAEASIVALLYAPTDDERLALREPLALMQAARTLSAALEFDEANEILVPLQKTLDDLISASDHTPDKMGAQWTEIAKPKGRLAKARTEVAELGKLMAKAAIPGNMEGLGDPMADRYNGYLDKIVQAAADKDWTKALKDFEGLSRQITSDLERHANLDKFLVERNRLAEPVAAEITRAELALKALEDALAQEPDPGNTLALAKAELDNAKRLWVHRASRAMTEGELDAGKALNTFKALATRLEKQTQSPQALQRALTAGRDDAAKKAFDAASAEVKLSLEELRTLDNDLYNQHAKTWTELGYAIFKEDLHAPGNPKERMATLKATVLQAITDATQLLTAAQTAAQNKYKEVALQLKELRKQADQSLRHRHRKIFAPFFDGLDQDLKDLSGMVASQSIKTAEAALLELTALAARATKLRSEIEAQPKEGSDQVAKSLLDAPEEPGLDFDEMNLDWLFSEAPDQPDQPEKPAANFRMVMEAVTAIQKSLTDKILKRCLPVQQLMLEEDFKTAQQDIYSLEPQAAFDSLRALNLRVNEAIARAATANELRTRFKDVDLPAVEQRFLALSGFKADTLRGKLSKLRKEPGAYLKELEARIKSAKTLVKEPQKEQKALDELGKILDEINAVIDNNNVLQPEQLVEQEKAAQARAFQKEKETTQWTALVKDFKRMGLARATTAVNEADGGDKSQLTDLNKMLKQAEDIFNDTGNFIGAVELLNNAKQYAERVIGHPMGLKAASRDELPKVKAHWKEAVAAFNSSVDAVVSSINSADDGVDVSGLFDEESDEGVQAKKRLDEAIAKSIAMLNSLKTLFNANIMDAPIAVLTSKQAAKAEKRASRELAMKYINGYREVIRTDPVLVKLMQKERPFGTVDFYGLNTALRDLDLNIQRAV